MQKLFVGNFDFEHQLAFGPGWQPSRAIRRLNAELAAAWIAIADDGDAIWIPEPIDSAFFEQLAEHGLPRIIPISESWQLIDEVQLCPWGWSQELHSWDHDHIHVDDAPSPSSIREANSRRLSARLEREWNIALPGASALRRIDDLVPCIERAASEFARSVEIQRWVVKSEFSMSARERVIGQGRSIDANTTNWIRKRLNGDDVLFFEPWVELVAEVGLQFRIPRAGTPRFECATEMITDECGTYRGSRIALSKENLSRLETRWKAAIDTGCRVAERLQELGYFGPLGIDASEYRLPNGEAAIRPIQDINARQTMGRLSLGFRRLLDEHQVASWLHVRWSSDSRFSPDEWLAFRKQTLPMKVRVIPTTPFIIGGEHTRHGTLLIVAETSCELSAAETVFLES